MATKNPTLRNQMADDFAAIFDGGSFIVYDGDDNELVEFPLASPAFGAAATGVITLLGVPISETASGVGTASYGILHEDLSLSGDLCTLTVTVGTTGTEAIISNTNIALGQSITLNSFTWTEPAS